MDMDSWAWVMASGRDEGLVSWVRPVVYSGGARCRVCFWVPGVVALC